MTITKNNILSEALKLSPIDKALLIEEVLSSFEFNGKNNIDQIWSKEAEDRIDAYENGKIKTISYQDVFKKINK